MKRKISLILAATLVSGMVNINVHAADGVFYTAQTFNASVTNDKPQTDGTITAEKVRTVQTDKNDKALYMSSVKKAMSVSFPLSMEETAATVSFDITVSKARPTGTVGFVNSSSKVEPLISFDGDNGIRLSDGKYIGNVGIDKTSNIKISVLKNKLSVYINGKCICKNRYMTTTLPAMCKAFQFDFTPAEGGSEVVLDNVYVYTGNPQKQDFPVEEYNESSIELVEEENKDTQTEEVEVGNRVFVDKDFEDEATQSVGFFLFSPKTNTMRFVTDRKTGNKYLEFIRNGTNDGLFDFSFGTQHSDRKYFVFDCDMKLTKNNPRITWQMGGGMIAADISTTGVMSSNGEQIYQIPYDEWVHYAVCMDYVKQQNHIYINGKYIGHPIDFTDDTVGYMKTFRSYFYQSGSGSVCYDNIRFYEGKEPKENLYADTDLEEDNTEAPKSLREELMYVERAQETLDAGGYTAISSYANTYYSKGKKGTLTNPCMNIDGRLYVPATELAHVLGYSADWNKDIGRIIINDTVKWMSGENGITVGGELVSDMGIPQIVGDEIYMPLRFLTERVLNKKITWNEKNIVIIGDSILEDKTTDILVNDPRYTTTYWEIADMLNYEIITGKEIREAYTKKANGAHPRIFVDKEDVDRMKKQYSSDERYKADVDYFIAQADKVIEENKPTTHVATVGGNLLSTARQILGRLQQFGVAWFITGDEKYAKQAWAEIASIGNLPTWDVGHWLDLAEFQAAFAIGYDWFYDYWSEEQKKFIKEKTINNAFNIQVQAYTGEASAGEVGQFNNRSIVMSTGTSMTAIAFFDDDPEFYSDILWRTMRNQHIVNRLWFPDGSWPEGGAYWEYTCQYFLYYVSSLKAAFGTDFRLMSAMGFDKAPNYLKTLATPVGALNFGDVGDMTARTNDYMTYIAKQFNDEDTLQYRYWSRNYLKGNPKLFDILFDDYSVEPDGEPHYALDTHLRGEAEIVTMRSAFMREATAVAFRGGYGKIPHGHWDVGTFVVDMLGERFANDYGTESYGAGGAGEALYRNRTEGHNCLVFNPNLTPGQTGTEEDFSPIEKLVSKEKGAYSILNMTEAYQKYVTSARRGYMLGNDRRSVIIRDEFTLKEKVSVNWFLQTGAAVEIVDNKTVILTKNKKQVKLEMLSSSRDAKFTAGPAQKLSTSPVASASETVNKGFTRLAISFDGMGSEYIEVRFIPLNDPAVDSDMLDTKLDDWYIADGAIEELPTLSGISIDGVAVSGFDKETKLYTTEIPDTYEKLPEITATTDDDAQITVEYPQNAEGVAKIKVAKSEYNFAVYQVAFKLMPTMPDVSKLKEIPIKKVKVSAEPQPENAAKGAIDRNTTTRWSAQDECWIEVELDGVYDLSRVGMITLEGSKRSMTFNIEVSTDGENYTRVYNNMTSGKSDELEYYNVEGAKAKYVRINCFGTTVGNWNSILEVYVYTDK